MKTLKEAQEEARLLINDPPKQSTLRSWANVRLISSKEGLEDAKGIYPAYVTAEIVAAVKMKKTRFMEKHVKNARLDAIAKGLFSKALENEGRDLDSFIEELYQVKLGDLMFELAGETQFSPERLNLALTWAAYFIKAQKDLREVKPLTERVEIESY